MPPKSRPPAPIDRPLSKAYLREFTGWSTAYPPGLSEPNSIRAMENVMVTREGAARVRPGLSSYLRTKATLPIVGSHELFYTPNGKAYLVAVRETVDVGTDDEREIVGFRVIGPNSSGTIVMDTLEAFDFTVPEGANVLSFTAATTYVKYLQIDNKIFALSNAPEGMLMFWVDEKKKAKKLQSITRPAWNSTDKLSAFPPTLAWIDGTVPSDTRTNLCTNPDFEKGLSGWKPGASTTQLFSSALAWTGTKSMGARPRPVRENWLSTPLHNVAATGFSGWTTLRASLAVSGSSLQITETTSSSDPGYGYARSPRFPVVAGKTARLAFDQTGSSSMYRRMAWIAYYRSNGDYLSTALVMEQSDTASGRKATGNITIPTQASFASVLIGVKPTSTSVAARINIKNIYFGPDSNTSALDGDDGEHFFWTGTPNASSSVYHPPQDLWAGGMAVPVGAGTHTSSAYVRAPVGKTVMIRSLGFNSNGLVVDTDTVSVVATGDWQRVSVSNNVGPSTTRLETWVITEWVYRGETTRVDGVLIEPNESVLKPYFSGATPRTVVGGVQTQNTWNGTAHASASTQRTWEPVAPTPRTAGADSLISNDATKNVYSFSFFYTVSNDLGESAASQVTTIKTQRPWSAWKWETSGGLDTSTPTKSVDQLTVLMPESVFDDAVAAGATKWTAYYYTQGPNDGPSVTAQRFAEVDLSSEPQYVTQGWARLTPQMSKIGIGDPLIPSVSTRLNASDPVKGSNGIVAADRLVLVGNPADPARITWSSGASGDYHNFSSLLGGGTKQLTSGNLYTTATVKLWQNPQSVDTLTILNMGDDGRSNAYYMQPANITSLSESISVMGFEEVNAMQGTIAPYGCEVVNNGLYRPLFHGVYKSTANNYNLSTKPVSDTISNMWRTLNSPHRIVSAQMDNRIYYLVHNIHGAALEDHCRGNEVWVLDLGTQTPTWSRWLVQGASLRAMDVDSVVMMSIIRPDGIFVFNEDRYSDESFNQTTGVLEDRPIRWYLETNTQGANRAHDAWCNLQQANAVVGNFLGQMRYGIRGQDVNGMPIELEKVLLSDNPPPDLASVVGMTNGFVMPTLAPTQREDYLLVRKIMKEWVFFAGSVDDVVDVDGSQVVVPRFSGGQVSSVQYRYTPATVNVGYEYGSVETFEYGSSAAANATTESGTPEPYVDMSWS